MTWGRWQRLCAWFALVAGLAWTIKFVILLATSGDPGPAQPLTGFILPTVGSISGLIASFGIAAPVVARRRALVAVPVTIVVGLVAVAVVSAASNLVLDWGPVADSSNVVVRTETSALVSGLLWLAVVLWLFPRRDDTSAPAAVNDARPIANTG